MVRTKANCGAVRATAEKATRKNLGGSSSRIDFGSPSSKKDKYAGGNPVCPRPTPTWQKPINSFFAKPQEVDVKDEGEKENVSPTKSPIPCDASTSNCVSSRDNGAVITMEEGISELD